MRRRLPPARDVRDEVDGEPDGLSRARVREPDIGHQDAVREPGQGLLGGVGVNGAEAAEVAGVDRLEEVEGRP